MLIYSSTSRIAFLLESYVHGADQVCVLAFLISGTSRCVQSALQHQVLAAPFPTISVLYLQDCFHDTRRPTLSASSSQNNEEGQVGPGAVYSELETKNDSIGECHSCFEVVAVRGGGASG